MWDSSHILQVTLYTTHILLHSPLQAYFPSIFDAQLQLQGQSMKSQDTIPSISFQFRYLWNFFEIGELVV